MKSEKIYTIVKTPKFLIFAATILFLLFLPKTKYEYISYLMLTFFGYGVSVLGFNVLFGYTGLLSFGHALFFSVGAYTVAFLMEIFSVHSMEIILILSVAIAGVVAAIIGLLCVRYNKAFFGLLTLAFNMLFYSFLLKFYFITGGDEGLRVLRPCLLGLNTLDLPKMQFLMQHYYYYILAVLGISMVIMWRIVSSPFGIFLKAIRENAEKAKYLGINVAKYKWYAFIISGIFTAIGGVLVAPIVGQVDPTMAYWTHSGTIVFMTLLGGFNSFLGPLLGSVIYIFFQDFVMSFLYYWRFVFGAMLIVIVLFAPEGILGTITSILKQIRNVITPMKMRGTDDSFSQ
jgi:branched-chain amino acid transport system permease protein